MCLVVSLAAVGLTSLERDLFGKIWLEPLVLAILIGAGVRAVWSPDERFKRGIGFSAKTLLEVAIVLLGASVSATTLAALGAEMILGVFGVVIISIFAGFAIGRALGLKTEMALLVACGNAICGNSAITAAAPVIKADGEEIAASIAFTAVLGVLVVLALPLLGDALSMTQLQYGALAGLSVYAVPQVLAATAPFGPAAIQTGTVVKLVRVLMLGPVILGLSLFFTNKAAATSKRPALTKLVPWFIIGFLVMIGLRSSGLIPQPILGPLSGASGDLTIIAMAALGLQTDLRAVARSGAKVAVCALLSLGALILASLSLIHWLGL